MNRPLYEYDETNMQQGAIQYLTADRVTWDNKLMWCISFCLMFALWIPMKKEIRRARRGGAETVEWNRSEDDILHDDEIDVPALGGATPGQMRLDFRRKSEEYKKCHAMPHEDDSIQNVISRFAVQHISARERSAIWLSKVINRCRTPEHCKTAERLVRNFQQLHDPEESLPLMGYLRAVQFGVSHTHTMSN